MKNKGKVIPYESMKGVEAMEDKETEKAFERYQSFVHRVLRHLQATGDITGTGDTVEDILEKLFCKIDTLTMDCINLRELKMWREGRAIKTLPDSNPYKGQPCKDCHRQPDQELVKALRGLMYSLDHIIDCIGNEEMSLKVASGIIDATEALAKHKENKNV